ncbi:MAG: HNH endonuclease [bacterium]|nr:HNH endonuclease [bacterium]
MAVDAALDMELRLSAFAYLRNLIAQSGGLVHWDDLKSGFTFRGQRFPLWVQQGIHKPKKLDAALSITTTYAKSPAHQPYDDHPGPDGYMRYKWEGTDPQRYTNRALRAACEHQLPLIWFQGVAPGVYLLVFPVYVLDEEPGLHQFVIALDEHQRNEWQRTRTEDPSLSTEYAHRVTKARLHQPLFRARVLAAYRSQCGVCRLRHPELLDAAHIKPDADGGEAVVPNGISMCKLHHAAYDNNLLGIDPDYRVKIRSDVRDETDGPTLRYAIQSLHDANLQIPHRRAAQPDRELLAERFELFLQAT